MGGCDRRAQILAAAERLFCRLGPSKATVADIAREAQVAVGSVYLEFSSKDAIAEALASVRHRRVLDAMEAAAQQEAPHAVRLSAVFDARTAALRAQAAGGAHASELVHCAASSAIKAAYQGFEQEERRLLLALLRSGIEAGAFAVEDPDEAASSLLRCYASFSPPWLFRLPEDELWRSLGAMHRLVLFGLVRR